MTNGWTLSMGEGSLLSRESLARRGGSPIAIIDDRHADIAGDHRWRGNAVELAGRAANSKALWAHARGPHAK